jgi:hypothetical protein
MNHGDFLQMLRALRQDPQRCARGAASAGERVVGYVGNDVPAALILAAGALPVRLWGSPAEATAAGRFVESSFAPGHVSIADQWLRGALGHLHTVVFARGDDSGQRLYYYLCELQRRRLCDGPRPLLFDVAGLDRAASAQHTLESTRLLATQLGVQPSTSSAALARVRRREDLLRAVRTRRASASPLAGSLAWLLNYASTCDWRESFDPAAAGWLDTAPVLASPKRILLAGDAPPDDQLHLAVEAAGGTFVDELVESSPVPDSGDAVDPLARIAAEFQRRESPARSMRRDAQWLAGHARELRADGVLLWLSEQNEALPWEVARQAQSLRAAGIPTLVLARQPWQVTSAAVAQVSRFTASPGDTP